LNSVVRASLGGLLLSLGGPTVTTAGWQLTFSDEFDGAALDRTKWKPSDLWGNQTLSGNNERQCYVAAGVRQFDGLLHLVAEPVATPARACKGAAKDLGFTSGMITTSGCNRFESGKECQSLKSFSQAYGYFEVRAKLPQGKGLWPAFWLVPMDGSWPPEIDIMEGLGQPSTVYHTYHYIDAAGARQRATGVYKGHDFTSSFSTFGLDWRPGLLIWYVNGRETHRFSDPSVTSKNMYILVNLAVGGHWPGDPDAATPFPSSLQVDYIRVYKRDIEGAPDDLPPTGSLNKPN
jgi:beta-glucanase (GH16 family)